MKDELGWADFMVTGETGRSAATGRWCAARLPFAGGMWPCEAVRVSQLYCPRRGKNRRPHGAVMLVAPVARGARLTDPDILACALLGALNAGNGINIYLRI